MIRVILQKKIKGVPIPDHAAITSWVNAAVVHTEKYIPPHQRRVVVRIIDLPESSALNATFRDKSGPTNILSFPDEPLSGLKAESLGDLAICAPLVLEEANAQCKSPEAHWAHLTIHGTLHLLGYDHRAETDAAIMEPLEIKIMESLNLSNPYE